MNNIHKTSILLFDFDGVIIDSIPIKTKAFAHAVSDYPDDQVEMFVQFHKDNGGMSRFLKFEHFLSNISGEEVTSEKVEILAEKFSSYVQEALSSPEYLISEVVNYIEEKQDVYNFYIISASDDAELKGLCRHFGIDSLFKGIHGTPPLNKTELMRDVLIKYKIDAGSTVYIGDSQNDYTASKNNNVPFFGYNNHKLKELADAQYLNSIYELDEKISRQ